MSSFFNTIKNITPKAVAALTALFCVFLLAFAFILEHFVDLVPCPLCIAQRIFFFLIALVAVALLWWPKVVTPKIAGVKITAYALLGGAIAGRQVWMQWHPPTGDSEGCVVLLGNFVQNFLQALGGSGDCAQVDWTFIGLSIAEWSLLCFAALLVIGIWFLLAPPQARVKDSQKVETYE